ncbi:23S rRNA (pseudouridine(1915)-N(3))-methyltransferase RlmH [Candidatus Mycoplasma pogonae]
MKINLFVVGSLKPEFKQIFNLYLKKIQHFANVNVVEIHESNDLNIKQKIDWETKKLLEKINLNLPTFLTSIQGKQVTSEEFVKYFETKEVNFIIGGSNGVDETRFKNKLQISKMTFPHQLFRVILIEQIYRALSIKNNLKYHK